jgi:hypothetical protein
MLKDQWTIERCGTYADKNTLWHFTSKENESVSLFLRAIDEDEAWIKLGKIVGQENEDVDTEVFEGKIILRDIYDLVFVDNYENGQQTLHKHLIEQGNQTVEVSVRIKP